MVVPRQNHLIWLGSHLYHGDHIWYGVVRVVVHEFNDHFISVEVFKFPSVEDRSYSKRLYLQPSAIPTIFSHGNIHNVGRPITLVYRSLFSSFVST